MAEVECNGFLLRGLKIEEHPQGWRLNPPGRKVAGAWQQVFQLCDRQLEARLLELLRGCLG